MRTRRLGLGGWGKGDYRVLYVARIYFYEALALRAGQQWGHGFGISSGATSLGPQVGPWIWGLKWGHQFGVSSGAMDFGSQAGPWIWGLKWGHGYGVSSNAIGLVVSSGTVNLGSQVGSWIWGLK